MRWGARSVIRRGVQGTLMVVGFGVCALVLAAAAGLGAGVGASLVGLLFAALPLGVVVPAFLWLDRFEAEPTRLLVLTFLWGALVASAGALVLNTSTMIALKDAGQDPLTLGAVVVAPVVEETLKGLVVLLIWRLRRQEFDGVVDGMVYAGISAAGFAFAENIIYLSRAFHEAGGSGLASVFFLRGVMGPFAHPLFTICTGIGLGVAAMSRRTSTRVLAPLLGWLVAVALHATWNLTTVAGLQGFLVAYVFLQLPVFAGFIGLAVWARRRARVWARMTGGRRSLAALTAFQDAASELALLRMRMARGAADAQAPARERALLQTLVQRRREFVGTSVT